MRLNRFGVFIGVIFFLIAGWLGYTLYKPDSNIRLDQSVISNLDVISIENPENDSVPQNKTEDESNSNGNDILQTPALSLLAASPNSDSDMPEVCFTFNRAFNTEDAITIRDYIAVTPSVAMSVAIRERSLCLSGFSYSETYKVTFKSGLIAADDSALATDTIKDISFGDKPPFVGFAGEGVILPRLNAQGLAIETVNVEKLNVTIFYVSDRMLARRQLSSGESRLEGDYRWEGQNAGTDLRREAWSGSVDIETEHNKRVTTVLPIQDLLGELKPGAYIVRAERDQEDGEDRVAKAWRWIMSTDLAMTSYRSSDGLTVAVRSIDSAKLLPKTRLVLVASNNEILAETFTDNTGRAKFAAPLMMGTGAMRPSVVMAYGQTGDYNVLNLDRSPVDLSKYDINGRTVSGDVDVFAYTERGIYRPGETVYLTGLVRDSQANAIIDRSVSIILRRPNGIEIDNTRIKSDELKVIAGGFTYNYELPRSASRGQYSVVIDVDGAARKETVSFAVEDFVPQKLRLTLSADETPLLKGDVRDVKIDAQFLYGAAGAALEAEAEARLRIDPNPFPDFSDFAFGPTRSNFRERVIELGGGKTDGSGVITLPLDINWKTFDTNHPLRAEITAGVAEPGGRYTRDSLRVPVRTKESYVGFRSETGIARFDKEKPTNISILAVNRFGESLAIEKNYRLIQEDWDYQWYRQNGRWRYRRDVIDTVVWAGGETSDTPDLIQMAGPTDLLKAGEDVTLSINAPYSGEAELVIANQSVQKIKTLKLKKGGSQIRFPFDPKWGESVYAMLSLYTPRDAIDRPIPRRAVGISYIALDRSEQILDVSFQAPQLTRPRDTQSISINVDNAPIGEQVYISITAVDEGILQLTKYKSPEAAKSLFGKKKLNLDVFDDYARLLNPNLGAPSIANSGGDSLG